METQLILPSETYKRKPGRPSQGNIKCQVVLNPDLVQWAKYLPEGVSGLLRRLMRDEYERQHRDRIDSRKT